LLELIRAVVSGYENVLSEANSIDLLPLHVAFDSRRKYEIIQSLFEENTRETAIVTNSGDLPIHITCRKRGTSLAIHALLNFFEGGAHIND